MKLKPAGIMRRVAAAFVDKAIILLLYFLYTWYPQKYLENMPQIGKLAGITISAISASASVVMGIIKVTELSYDFTEKFGKVIADTAISAHKTKHKRGALSVFT